ncbi:MAG: hypothetical protein GX222_07765 [Ruminococcaceae bacterium]|nr:hypothetical protein [Oscillospiraceae bacterium]
MERLTRSKAIRAKCLDCCCGSAKEVRLCSIKSCALWRFRMGREMVDTLTPKRTKVKKSHRHSFFKEGD